MAAMVGALILAAGEGKRFGADKRLAVLPDGRPMLEATVGLYRQIFPAIRVVLDDESQRLEARLIRSNLLMADEIVQSAHSRRGMGATLADGMVATQSWDLTFIALGDMPFVRTRTLEQLHRLALDTSTGAHAQRRILLPMHRMQGGHPVAFTPGFYEHLACLDGARGARDLVQENQQVVTRISLNDPGILWDIDVPEELSGPSP